MRFIFVCFVFVESTELFIFKTNNCQVRDYLTFMHSYLMVNLFEDFLSFIHFGYIHFYTLGIDYRIIELISLK